MSKQRIVELQKSLKIAREALERIKCGTTRAHSIAEDALDKMWKLEPKQHLQGIVGHAPKEFWTKGLR
jgi:hypothetical protein